MTAQALEHDLVIVACAVSAGIHGALVGDHFAEGAGAGIGFLAATILLAGLVVALTRRPAARMPLLGAAAVLAALIASYALATTTGVPVLHPDPEPVDGLALATKAFEAVGLVGALHLLSRPHTAAVFTLSRPEGTST